MRALSRSARAIVLGASLAGVAVHAQGPMSSTGPAGGANPAASAASAAGAGTADATLDVQKLFATTCGWCHSGAGRVAGKGPQLMGTKLTDAEIAYRIKNGKPGAMPAFGSTFTEEQIKAIIAYIRNLKPEGAPKS
jgi:mono/diheme cytochrome c family protein